MDKAREFALDALKQQIELIENAYNAGYADALNSIPKPDVESELGIKFVDLGLQDNLMWSNTVLGIPVPNGGRKIYLPYCEASQYDLPNIEQYGVFFKHCKRYGVSLISPFGIDIRFPGNSQVYYLWVKSEVVNDEALAFKITHDKDPELIRRYTGETALSLLIK